MRALLRWPACDAANGWTRDDDGGTADGEAAVVLLGPEARAPERFTEAIPSWGASTPGDSWIEIELRVRRDGRWSGWFRVARWDDRLQGSRRTSFDAQRDEDGRVAVDTFVATGPCEAIQPRLLLCGSPPPTVHFFTLALSAEGPRAGQQALPATRELDVPPRSQMVYPDGGDGWCSPTSVTMVLNYWHARTGDERLEPFLAHESVPEVAAPLCFDPAYGGTGNWIFNTAFAASLGLDAYVTRLSGVGEVVPWVEAGVPVIVSVAWKDRELTGAPIPKSNGHLLVVTGFDGQGGVLVADPAAPDVTGVRRRYDSGEFETAWQNNSQGTVYLIHPFFWHNLCL